MARFAVQVISTFDPESISGETAKMQLEQELDQLFQDNPGYLGSGAAVVRAEFGEGQVVVVTAVYGTKDQSRSAASLVNAWLADHKSPGTFLVVTPTLR